jgi:hypothetical protein
MSLLQIELLALLASSFKTICHVSPKYVSMETSILGCNAVWFRDGPTFRKNISPPSSGSESKPASRSRLQFETLVVCSTLSLNSSPQKAPFHKGPMYDKHLQLNLNIRDISMGAKAAGYSDAASVAMGWWTNMEPLVELAGETEVLVPMPLSTPQIQHHLTWDQTRVVGVGTRRMTAWATVGRYLWRTSKTACGIRLFSRWL